MRGLKAMSVLLAGGVALTLGACEDQPTQPQSDALTPQAMSALGNGFPEPGHDFNLHIIGVPQDKTADMDGNNGRRIFVQLESDNEVTDPGGKNNNHLGKGGNNDQNHIYLCNSTNDEGDSTDPRCAAFGNTDTWGVIDANATDGDGALLAVPDPCADDDSTTDCTPRWSVWARALGTPGGTATITTCADEELEFDGLKDTWCGDNGVTIGTNHGRKATDVSENLLFMTITVDDTLDPDLAACIEGGATGDAVDGLPDSYDVFLFDRCFQDYFWNYDNNGLKNLELRFYRS